jgi:hypothetical protein
MRQNEFPYREVYVVTLKTQDEKTFVMRLPEERAEDAIERARQLRPSCTMVSIQPQK